MRYKSSFKFNIILTAFCYIFLINTGCAISKQPEKQCPDPNLKYETENVENYWQWFATNNVSDLVEGDKYICVKYSEQGEHGPYSINLIVSKAEINDRKKKEAGLIRGVSIIFRQYDHLLASNNEVVLKAVYDEFSSKFASRAEMITGLRFATAKEWFYWWESNKDKLVLSENGNHLVAIKSK